MTIIGGGNVKCYDDRKVGVQIMAIGQYQEGGFMAKYDNVTMGSGPTKSDDVIYR